jgi:ABC-type transporter Mla maintaining outer membrane lipid asymmetry ATPase subunit MlaF
MTTEASNTDSGTAVIEMTGVTVGSLRDQESVVLENVDWRVVAGDYWVIAGMHSSGKSDLMALTGGLMPPRAGGYRLFGRTMPIYEEELLPERLRLGLVFDGGHLFHHLTVAENIALPLRYHRALETQELQQRVEAMLEAMELSPWANSRPGALGRNWQKRVGLARALMLEPEALVLDNPLGGLDSRHMVWWLNFLGQLSAGGGFRQGRRMTLVVTAEDLRPWRQRATRFAILQDRRLVTVGERSTLDAHDDPLVKELLADEFSGT